ncbi:winged helix DNA-binding protein [Altererythrobacter sp. CC-YST694]|uniref:MarR family transcriptional regulator n=1 Tax=Altererythrobacter sp. CC-YST694 TaxID=2755038 RepID=UPI001D012588|nr:MarR family transcriptional regulator [Altererythrobacter sp. CC-YST694]MCB5424548.1 winged helix DNA-binding protein [Altererythrobacter sp. CC-YST694]
MNGTTIPKLDESAINSLAVFLGQQAEDALRLVDRLAMGAATETFANGGEASSPGEEFTRQLDRILEGFTPVTAAGSAQPQGQAPPRLFQSELWQVLHKVRESAELFYAREIDLVELDRRILFLLKIRGPLVPAGLSSAIGVDKAQVSRSVKRLLELKLVQREQIRSPVALTRKGEALGERLLRMAELRNRELAFDVSDKELQDFFAVTEILLDRAVTLYEQERELAHKAGRSDQEIEPGHGIEVGRVNEPIVIDRSRIVSPLLTLSAYFSRSGALAFKRRTGLSNFEAWVLSEIGKNPPTDWAYLVRILERDHSQAGRTVNHLIEKGLVVREGKLGRRHGRFSPSAEGQVLYDIIVETGFNRSKFLMEPVPARQLEAFLTTFDKIRRNAAAQLERERAFEELESH